MSHVKLATPKKRLKYELRPVLLDGQTVHAVYVNGLRSWRHGVFRDRGVAQAEITRLAKLWPTRRIDQDATLTQPA